MWLESRSAPPSIGAQTFPVIMSSVSRPGPVSLNSYRGLLAVVVAEVEDVSMSSPTISFALKRPFCLTTWAVTTSGGDAAPALPAQTRKDQSNRVEVQAIGMTARQAVPLQGCSRR